MLSGCKFHVVADRWPLAESVQMHRAEVSTTQPGQVMSLYHAVISRLYHTVISSCFLLAFTLSCDGTKNHLDVGFV